MRLAAAEAAAAAAASTAQQVVMKTDEIFPAPTRPFFYI
jgi:hypothetical protein